MKDIWKHLLKVCFSLILFLADASYAYDLKAELSPASDEMVELKPGGFFLGRIRLWPYPSKDYKDFESLEGKKFLDYFHVVSISKIEPSPNNHEVLEIYGKFILEKLFQQDGVYIWTLRDINIPTQIRKIKAKNLSQMSQDFLVLNSKYSPPMTLSAYHLLIGVFLLVLIFVFMTLYKKRSARKREQEKILKARRLWAERFANATTRENFENIYAKREEWLSLLGRVTPPIQNFLNTVYSVQYKPALTDSELQEVKDSFSEIRNAFE